VSALLLALAYLAGSIPFGLFIARTLTGKDVRSVGSGNIGATNVARAAGKGAAAATLILDALKGLAPVLLARLVQDPRPFRSAAGLAAACGVLAVVGHCFPVWLRFRGGKGVATGLGVGLALAPVAAFHVLGDSTSFLFDPVSRPVEIAPLFLRTPPARTIMPPGESPAWTPWTFRSRVSFQRSLAIGFFAHKLQSDLSAAEAAGCSTSGSFFLRRQFRQQLVGNI